MENNLFKKLILPAGLIIIITAQVINYIDLRALKNAQEKESLTTDTLLRAFAAVDIAAAPQPDDVGGPAVGSTVETMTDEFVEHYKDGTLGNPMNINPNIRSVKNKLDWAFLFQHIDSLHMRNDVDTVIAAYYVLDTLMSDTIFTYALTVAKKIVMPGSKDSIAPIGLFRGGMYRPGEYFVLRGPGLPVVITEDQCMIKRNWYKNQVKVFTLLSTVRVGSVLNYPRLCFFDGEELMNFYTHNRDVAGVNYSLYVKNSAKKYSGISLYRVQVPVMITEDIFGDLLDEENDKEAQYKRKALNVGRLCPPACKCN